MCVFVCIFLISLSSGDDLGRIFPGIIIFYQGSGSDPRSRKICIDIGITDDDILENDESLSVHLTTINLPRNVFVFPDTAEILILDDDGMLIVFVLPYLLNIIITRVEASTFNLLGHIINSNGLRDVPHMRRDNCKKK